MEASFSTKPPSPRIFIFQIQMRQHAGGKSDSRTYLLRGHRTSSSTEYSSHIFKRKSHTGGKSDSWAIDYQATKDVLDMGREMGASHFVLLSAICVQKPLLEFQRAKLKLEGELKVRRFGRSGVAFAFQRMACSRVWLCGRLWWL